MKKFIKSLNIKPPSKKFWAREILIIVATVLLLVLVSIYENNKIIENYNEKDTLESKLQVDYFEDFYFYMLGNLTGDGSKMDINTFRTKLLNNELFTYKLFKGAPISQDRFFVLYIHYLRNKRGNDVLTYEQFEKETNEWDFDKYEKQKHLKTKIKDVQQKIDKLKNTLFIETILIAVYPFRAFIFLIIWSIGVYRKKEI
jgi:hypothetical protein